MQSSGIVAEKKARSRNLRPKLSPINFALTGLLDLISEEGSNTHLFFSYILAPPTISSVSVCKQKFVHKIVPVQKKLLWLSFARP